MYFYLNGTVNKQNCGFWAAFNLNLIDKLPFHFPWVTAWSSCWIGNYGFFLKVTLTQITSDASNIPFSCSLWKHKLSNTWKNHKSTRIITRSSSPLLRSSCFPNLTSRLIFLYETKSCTMDELKIHIRQKIKWIQKKKFQKV